MLEEQSSGVTTTQYVLSPFYVNQMIERDDHDPATSGLSLNRRLYPTYDADYNITSLSNGSSSEGVLGAVDEWYEYDPDGNVTVLNPNGTSLSSGAITNRNYGWVYTFQSGRTDPETGLIKFGVRDYDPGTGTWKEQDPTGTEYVNGPDTYQFELSNSSYSLDPTGKLDDIDSWEDAFYHYNEGTGTVKGISQRLKTEIMQMPGYIQERNNVVIEVFKWAKNLPPPTCHSTHQSIKIPYKFVIHPSDNFLQGDTDFLIGVGTMVIYTTASFDVDTGAQDSEGNATRTISNVNIDFNLRKLYSFDKKSTVWGKVYNAPFDFVFGTIGRGKNFFIDDQWSETLYKEFSTQVHNSNCKSWPLGPPRPKVWDIAKG